MIEQHRRTLLFPVQGDVNTFQQRANNQRYRYKRSSSSLVATHRLVTPLLTSSAQSLTRLPSRYLLHTVIALTLPLALVLSQVPVSSPVVEQLPVSSNLADAPISLGPISLDATDSLARVGDPPLAASDALPMPLTLPSRSEAFAPLVVPATIVGDVAKLRNGPGLEYDDVHRLNGGTPVQVIGRFGDWFQVRAGNDQPVYWVAGELIDIPQGAIYNLVDVPQADIPPPPPPKVATVREEGLRLRDGPGTNYVRMTSLEAGQTLSLIEQYQGWMHVATDDFDGWVTAEFLDIEPGILERVPTTDTIPDPNPALVGAVIENSVNTRKGPGTIYDSLGKVDAGLQVDLLARHKDWYKVQLGDGTTAWIFGELMDVTPMVQRRVPHTNDIPAPPAPIVRQGGASSANSGGGGFAGLPASGDVAGFAAQFVGYRYTYGGASPGTGFDCSGLTSYVYRQFGVYLPHRAAAQYSSAYGAIVGSMNSLAPGDLMFFVGTGGGRGITHVSIYIGGGRMVHAMMPGLGVQVSNIYESYWVNHFYGALRVRR